MEFRVRCAYDKDSNLRLKYADDYNPGILLTDDNLDPREYIEEIFAEPERLEKNYVLQLITNRLSRYIETVADVRVGM
jgi:hypothetical protein